MVTPRYLETMKDLVLPALEIVRVEALAALPDELRWEQERLAKSRQFLDCWREAEEQYIARNRHPNGYILSALGTLSLVAEFIAKMDGLGFELEAYEQEAQREANGEAKYDLQLGKVRREVRR